MKIFWMLYFLEADVYLATFTDEYSDYSRIIKNNFDLKFSLDKLNSIKVSAPKEDWRAMFLEIPTYHSRYKELSSRDFEFITGKETPYANGYYKATDEGSISPKRCGITEIDLPFGNFFQKQLFHRR